MFRNKALKNNFVHDARLGIICVGGGNRDKIAFVIILGLLSTRNLY